MRPPVRALSMHLDALWQLARTSWTFRVRGRRAVAAATHRATRAAAAPNDVALAHRAEIWQADRALRRAAAIWPLRAACLQRAFVMQRLLRRRGLPSRVVVGSRLEGAELTAHAWVEIGDLKLDAHGEFASFEAFARAADRAAGPPTRNET